MITPVNRVVRNYRMKRSIKLLLVLSVIATSFTHAPESQAFSERSLVRLTNQHREKALVIDHRLSIVAQTKANDMVNKNYFSHLTPDGHTPWYFFQQMGYSYTSAGENLALDYSTNKDVVDAWMESPSHRANIVNPNYTKVGIGIARKGIHVYIVQLFAQP